MDAQQLWRLYATSRPDFSNLGYDTSPISTSTLSIYTPLDSDLNVFDNSFSRVGGQRYHFPELYEDDKTASREIVPECSKDFQWRPGRSPILPEVLDHQMLQKYAMTSLNSDPTYGTHNMVPGIPPPSVNSPSPPGCIPARAPNTMIFSSLPLRIGSQSTSIATLPTIAENVPRQQTRFRPRKSQSPSNNLREHENSPPPPVRNFPVSLVSNATGGKMSRGVSKRTHNQVEKQYRNRLNDNFVKLLGNIPDEIVRLSFI